MSKTYNHEAQMALNRKNIGEAYAALTESFNCLHEHFCGPRAECVQYLDLRNMDKAITALFNAKRATRVAARARLWADWFDDFYAWLTRMTPPTEVFTPQRSRFVHLLIQHAARAIQNGPLKDDYWLENHDKFVSTAIPHHDAILLFTLYPHVRDLTELFEVYSTAVLADDISARAEKLKATIDHCECYAAKSRCEKHKPTADRSPPREKKASLEDFIGTKQAVTGDSWLDDSEDEALDPNDKTVVNNLSAPTQEIDFLEADKEVANAVISHAAGSDSMGADDSLLGKTVSLLSTRSTLSITTVGVDSTETITHEVEKKEVVVTPATPPTPPQVTVDAPPPAPATLPPPPPPPPQGIKFGVAAQIALRVKKWALKVLPFGIMDVELPEDYSLRDTDTTTPISTRAQPQDIAMLGSTIRIWGTEYLQKKGFSEKEVDAQLLIPDPAREAYIAKKGKEYQEGMARHINTIAANAALANEYTRWYRLYKAGIDKSAVIIDPSIPNGKKELDAFWRELEGYCHFAEHGVVDPKWKPLRNVPLELSTNTDLLGAKDISDANRGSQSANSLAVPSPAGAAPTSSNTSQRRYTDWIEAGDVKFRFQTDNTSGFVIWGTLDQQEAMVRLFRSEASGKNQFEMLEQPPMRPETGAVRKQPKKKNVSQATQGRDNVEAGKVKQIGKNQIQQAKKAALKEVRLSANEARKRWTAVMNSFNKVKEIPFKVDMLANKKRTWVVDIEELLSTLPVEDHNRALFAAKLFLVECSKGGSKGANSPNLINPNSMVSEEAMIKSLGLTDNDGCFVYYPILRPKSVHVNTLTVNAYDKSKEHVAHNVQKEAAGIRLDSYTEFPPLEVKPPSFIDSEMEALLKHILNKRQAAALSLMEQCGDEPDGPEAASIDPAVKEMFQKWKNSPNLPQTIEELKKLYPQYCEGNSDDVGEAKDVPTSGANQVDEVQREEPTIPEPVVPPQPAEAENQAEKSQSPTSIPDTAPPAPHNTYIRSDLREEAAHSLYRVISDNDSGRAVPVIAPQSTLDYEYETQLLDTLRAYASGQITPTAEQEYDMLMDAGYLFDTQKSGKHSVSCPNSKKLAFDHTPPGVTQNAIQVAAQLINARTDLVYYGDGVFVIHDEITDNPMIPGWQRKRYSTVWRRFYNPKDGQVAATRVHQSHPHPICKLESPAFGAYVSDNRNTVTVRAIRDMFIGRWRLAARDADAMAHILLESGYLYDTSGLYTLGYLYAFLREDCARSNVLLEWHQEDGVEEVPRVAILPTANGVEPAVQADFVRAIRLWIQQGYFVLLRSELNDAFYNVARLLGNGMVGIANANPADQRHILLDFDLPAVRFAIIEDEPDYGQPDWELPDAEDIVQFMVWLATKMNVEGHQIQGYMQAVSLINGRLAPRNGRDGDKRVFMTSDLQVEHVEIREPRGYHALTYLWGMPQSCELDGNLRNDRPYLVANDIRRLNHMGAFLAAFISLGISILLNYVNVTGNVLAQAVAGGAIAGPAYNFMRQLLEHTQTYALIWSAAFAMVRQMSQIQFALGVWRLINWGHLRAGVRPANADDYWGMWWRNRIPYWMDPLSVAQHLNCLPDVLGLGNPPISFDIRTEVFPNADQADQGFFADRGCVEYEDRCRGTAPYLFVAYGLQVINAIRQHFRLRQVWAIECRVYARGLFRDNRYAVNHNGRVVQAAVRYDEEMGFVKYGSMLSFDWANERVLSPILTLQQMGDNVVHNVVNMPIVDSLYAGIVTQRPTYGVGRIAGPLELLSIGGGSSSSAGGPSGGSGSGSAPVNNAPHIAPPAAHNEQVSAYAANTSGTPAGMYLPLQNPMLPTGHVVDVPADLRPGDVRHAARAKDQQNKRSTTSAGDQSGEASLEQRASREGAVDELAEAVRQARLQEATARYNEAMDPQYDSATTSDSYSYVR